MNSLNAKLNMKMENLLTNEDDEFVCDSDRSNDSDNFEQNLNRNLPYPKSSHGTRKGSEALLSPSKFDKKSQTSTPESKKASLTFDFKGGLNPALSHLYGATTATAGASTKSAFSKKTCQSKGNFEESAFGHISSTQPERLKLEKHSDNESGTHSLLHDFLVQFREDFDWIKSFEDTAVKIYNLLSVTKFVHPEDANEYPAIYKKLSPHN